MEPENPADDVYTLQRKILLLKGTKDYDRLQYLITEKERKGDIPKVLYEELKRLKAEAEE